MYKPAIGNGPCAACPVGSTASYDRTSCMCEAGSYFEPDEGGAGISKPLNPRRFDTIEGGFVLQAVVAWVSAARRVCLSTSDGERLKAGECDRHALHIRRFKKCLRRSM